MVMPPTGSARSAVSSRRRRRPVNCFVWIDLEREGRRRNTSAGQMGRVGVRHDQLGERVELQLGAEVEPGGALQIVEAVAVLQLLELVLEHEVEGRAEQAAERHLLLGQAADPEVDVVDAGAWYAVHPWRSRGWPRRRCCSGSRDGRHRLTPSTPPALCLAEHEGRRRGALVRQRCRRW